MKKSICSLIAVSIVVLGSRLHAQEANQASDETGESIVLELDAEIKALNDAYHAKLKSLRANAAKKLTALQKEVAADDLDTAIRLRDLAKKLLDEGTETPAADQAVASAEAKKSDKREAVQKELREKNAELEKQLGLQSKLTKQIVGTSYRIQIGNDIHVWTFAPNGALVNDGKATATRWSAFGDDGVICAGYDNGFIDICQFTDDFRKIEVIFVGDYKSSKTHHVGTIVKGKP